MLIKVKIRYIYAGCDVESMRQYDFTVIYRMFILV